MKMMELVVEGERPLRRGPAIYFLEGHDALVLAAPRQVALVVPYELARAALLADPVNNSLGVAIISFGGADEREARHAL